MAFLILPGLSIFRACFCGHGSGAAEHHAAGCSCPVHAAREGGAEPCHGHGDAAAAATHCSLRGAQDLPTDLLASLEALARPAVLAGARGPDGPRPAGTIADSNFSVPALDGPLPPTPPPRLSSHST